MHKLYDLKEMLCDELEKYGDKKELTAGTLDVVDKLAHATKNICKIIEDCEHDGEYSNRMVYDDGMRSYARRRDAMGRYSRDGYSMAKDDLAEELRDLMQDAPDQQTKHEIKRIVDRLSQM